MKDLILAIQFLTRIPLNITIETKENSFADSVLWFPTAGLLVGLVNAAAYLTASFLLDGLFPIVCAVLTNVLITGALHLDGLADTCDGIFSSRKREKMLEIMKDSRIGTNGAIALVFDLLMRAVLLASLPEDKVLWVIITLPIVSKAILPLIMKLSVYARAEGGMGGLFLGKQGWTRTSIAFIAGAAASAWVFGYIGLVFFTAALIGMLIFRGYIYSKLQGMTGDTIGASSEIGELVFALAAAVIWRQLL